MVLLSGLFVVCCLLQDVLHQVAELQFMWTEAQTDFVGTYICGGEWIVWWDRGGGVGVRCVGSVGGMSERCGGRGRGGWEVWWEGERVMKRGGRWEVWNVCVVNSGKSVL